MLIQFFFMIRMMYIKIVELTIFLVFSQISNVDIEVKIIDYSKFKHFIFLKKLKNKSKKSLSTQRFQYTVIWISKKKLS